jgi:hypothetical protein
MYLSQCQCIFVVLVVTRFLVLIAPCVDGQRRCAVNMIKRQQVFEAIEVVEIVKEWQHCCTCGRSAMDDEGMSVGVRRTRR